MHAVILTATNQYVFHDRMITVTNHAKFKCRQKK